MIKRRTWSPSSRNETRRRQPVSASSVISMNSTGENTFVETLEYRRFKEFCDACSRYARVSTLEQNLDLQLQALKKAGCRRIFQEKISAGARNRPEFQRMLDQIRAGDTI